MQVLLYTLCFGLGAVGVASLGLLGWVLWPGRARAARERIEQSRGRCLVIGLLHLLALLFLLAVTDRRGGGAGLLVAAFLVWMAWKLLTALPGVLSWLGESLGSLADRPELDTARATIWGAFLLAGVGLVPWLGWALLTACLAATCGCGVLGGWKRK